jgi:Kef-type K+ transport system membrane component KefB
VLEPLIATAVLLAAGITGAVLARALRVSPIVGYLVAGAVVGPHALDVAPTENALHFLAELGVAFLLFDVGLHFSLKDLWRARRQLALGPLQMALAGALLAALAAASGIGGQGALYLGATLALSSTAVTIQSLRERGESNQPIGKSATAVLVFQDLAAVVLISLVGAAAMAHGGADASAGHGGAGIDEPAAWVVAGRALLGLAAVALLGRALRPLFAMTSRAGEDVFTATVLLVVLATGGATAMVGLSLPLGAFLGGMLLSESEYCYMVKTELRPFRGLLLGLFFLTVGIALDLPMVLGAAGTVLAIAAGMLAAKVVSTALAARLTGACPGFSLRLGFSLAQGSEFALVVLPLLAGAGLVAAGDASRVASAVVLSMAVSPLLTVLGSRLADRVERRRAEPAAASPATDTALGHPGRILIDGSGDVALRVAAALAEHGADYLLLESDPQRVARARAEGYRVALGSAASLGMVEHSSAEGLSGLVLAGANSEPGLVRILRQRHPGLTVLARDGRDDALALSEAGAWVYDPGAAGHDVALAEKVLSLAGVPEEDRIRYVARFDVTPWETADKAHAA